MAGRYEFHDKGIDLFIKALAKLNDEMKKENSEKSVVAFIWVPNSIKEIKQELLQSKNYYQDVDDTIHDMLDEIKDKMIYGIMSKKELTEDYLLGESVKRQLEKMVVRFNLNGNPPLCTHNLYNEQSDEMMNALKQNGLLNSKEDKVKVILYPIYLTGADQLIDLGYYEAIMACHLGVFPSYYEPWGYTPMEAGALGVASVTTDLSGFGKYLQQISPDKKNPGIYVLKRLNRKDEDVTEDLFKVFNDFKNLSKQERIENKLKAKSLADTCDWKILAENYIKAHDIAAMKNG
jgi:glycogen(starch) synthase